MKKNLRNTAPLLNFTLPAYASESNLSPWPPNLLAPASSQPECLPARAPTHLQVKRAQGKFEERLWSIVRNFLEVSRADPDLLVSALQAVELQELVDAQLAAAGQGGCYSSIKSNCFSSRSITEVGGCQFYHFSS